MKIWWPGLPHSQARHSPEKLHDYFSIQRANYLGEELLGLGVCSKVAVKAERIDVLDPSKEAGFEDMEHHIARRKKPELVQGGGALLVRSGGLQVQLCFGNKLFTPSDEVQVPLGLGHE